MQGQVRWSPEGLEPSSIGKAGVAAGKTRALGKAGEAILRRYRSERQQGRHAFWDLPLAKTLPERILRFAASRKGSYDAVVVLGIGGSALGTSAVAAALGTRAKLVVLDNVDPETLARFAEGFEPARSIVCAVSKSGTTVETFAQLLWIRDRMRRALGEGFRDRIVAVTDPERGPLRELVRKDRLPSFEIPPAVGGRFSVLSAAGLVPLALAGVDIRGVLSGAARMRARCETAPFERNPALQSAAALAALYRRGVRNVVVMPYATCLWGLSDWYRQLLAESLGKRKDTSGREVFAGLTPILALGVTDQHSQLQLYVEGPKDKVVLFLVAERLRTDIRIPRTAHPAFRFLSGRTFGRLLAAEFQGTERSLEEAGRPTARITFPGVTPRTVGQFLFWMEAKVAILGGLLDVDPYDQPGVERGKVLAREILERP